MPRRFFDDDLVAIHDRRLAGERYSDMAREFAVCPQRVRQLTRQGWIVKLRRWKFANGWTVDGKGGMWVDPPGNPADWPKVPDGYLLW